MDEVIADFIPKQLRLFNEEFHESLTVDDLHGKKLKELRPQFEESINNYLRDPSFFRDLKVMEHSQKVIKELNEYFEIFITTAAMEFPPSFTAKYEWLKEHFPFLNDLNFVFCGDKSIVLADYLIDDNARHFKKFTGKGIIFTSPHNVNVTGYDRVNNWLEVKKYFIK